MKKYRINTTISQKHQEILKKHTKKYGTQQSVLEHALETLENNIEIQNLELSPEEELWMRIHREIKSGMTLFQRDITKMLFETLDIPKFDELVTTQKPAQFALEWYYNKSIKECSIQEIINAIIINTNIQGGADTVKHTEGENSYNINITHSMGINWGKGLVMMYESMLKSYGAYFESNFSERSVYFKIFK